MGYFLYLRLEPDPWRRRTMKKARLTEEQSIGILQEHEAEAKFAASTECLRLRSMPRRRSIPG